MYFIRTIGKPHHIMAIDVMELNYKSRCNKIINIQRGYEPKVQEINCHP